MTSMAPLAIHWCKWRFISVISVNDTNGTNDSSGVIDFTVQWRVWNVEDTLPFTNAIGANDATGASDAVGANVANGMTFTIVAIETIVAIGVIVNMTNVWS